MCICMHVASMYLFPLINSYVRIFLITGVPAMVSDIMFVITFKSKNITLALNWGESFNNLDPIVNYTLSCSGDVTCPPNFTTTDNTTRRYTITNLTPMTTYTFSVVATNSIGSGEAGVVMITTPGEVSLHEFICTYVVIRSMYICAL